MAKNYKSYEELIKVSNEDLLNEWDANMDIYYICEPIRKRNKENKREKDNGEYNYD